MANFTEESFDEQDQEVVDLFSGQDEEPQVEQTPEPEEKEVVAQESEEEELPSKYKGKSVQDIIRMHQEAEKLIGRQAQEVGEVRKLADELIKRQLEGGVKPQVEEATKEDEIDFLEDPEKYLNKKLEKHPAILEAKQQAMQMKQAQFAQKLQSSFPDFQQTVQDPEFVEWVKASPVRLQLYADADSNLNYDSAAELLGTWGYVKGTKQPVATQQVADETIKQDRKQALKSAAVNTGSVGVSSKKTYRREDIRNLMIRDPDRYQAMQPELMAAYAEGRVI